MLITYCFIILEINVYDGISAVVGSPVEINNTYFLQIMCKIILKND